VRCVFGWVVLWAEFVVTYFLFFLMGERLIVGLRDFRCLVV
jgi:hypothetical protein